MRLSFPERRNAELPKIPDARPSPTGVRQEGGKQQEDIFLTPLSRTLSRKSQKYPGKKRDRGDVYHLQRSQKRLKMFKGQKLKEEELAYFAYELSQLIDCGMALDEGLALLCKNKHFPSQTTRAVLTRLRQGDSFSQALQKAGFPSLFVVVMHTAEAYGGYAHALKEIAEYYFQESDVKRELRQSSAYPLFILLMVMISLFFMMFFVLPNFESLYRSMQVELPWWTKAILAFVSWVQFHMRWLPLLISFILLLAFFLLFHTSWQRLWRNRLYSIPGVSNWFQARNTHFLVQQLGLLLKNGVSLGQACALLAQEIPWVEMRLVLRDVLEQLEQGLAMSDAFGRHERLFEPFLAEKIRVAETSGNLAESLVRMGQRTGKKLKQQGHFIVKMMEPLFILFVGMLMGLMILTMYLPMVRLIGEI